MDQMEQLAAEFLGKCAGKGRNEQGELLSYYAQQAQLRFRWPYADAKGFLYTCLTGDVSGICAG